MVLYRFCFGFGFDLAFALDLDLDLGLIWIWILIWLGFGWDLAWISAHSSSNSSRSSLGSPRKLHSMMHLIPFLASVTLLQLFPATFLGAPGDYLGASWAPLVGSLDVGAPYLGASI